MKFVKLITNATGQNFTTNVDVRYAEMFNAMICRIKTWDFVLFLKTVLLPNQILNITVSRTGTKYNYNIKQ